MEIRLHNNDRLQLRWLNPDLLIVELYRPTNMKDGHGLVLSGSAYLDGAALEQFLTALRPPEEKARVHDWES